MALLCLLVSAPVRAQGTSCGDDLREAEAAATARDFRAAGGHYVHAARNPDCGDEDRARAMSLAADAYTEASLVGRAIRVRTVLVRVFPETERARRALYLIGRDYEQIAMIERAAAFYERFASAYPASDGSECSEREREAERCPDATVALWKVIYFRNALGDRDAARAAGETYLRNYARSRPEASAEVAYFLAGLPDDEAERVPLYEAFLRGHDGAGRIDHRAEANLFVGRHHAAAGQRADAEPFLTRAVEIGRAPSDEDEYRLVRARSAAADAMVLLADARAAAVSFSRPPRVRGPHTEEGINAWFRGPFAEWHLDQQERLLPVVEAYNAVAELDMPGASIAAASSLSAFYERLLSTAEVEPPRWVSRDEGLAAAFANDRAAALSGLVARVLDTAEYCAVTSLRIRWPSEEAARCFALLERRAADRYPAQHELVGEPAAAGPREAEPPLVRSEDWVE